MRRSALWQPALVAIAEDVEGLEIIPWINAAGVSYGNVGLFCGV